MRIDILTLFPDTVNAVLHESIIGRAAKKGIVDINCVQIRDFTENKQKQVDDYPYGGGHGLNFQAEYQEYNVIAQPDGSDMIRILVKTDEDTHVYTFTIYDNGKVNLLVQSRNREPVSYYGEIRFSDDEDN